MSALGPVPSHELIPAGAGNGVPGTQLIPACHQAWQHWAPGKVLDTRVTGMEHKEELFGHFSGNHVLLILIRKQFSVGPYYCQGSVST